ncbi:MAG TPA: LytTR family DNA-binding domain-containing protein [Caulobacteraceae bacterium]|nr:LytTR family DNA-binding domain-containing protein [Caulobacteraceae bacterium]
MPAQARPAEPRTFAAHLAAACRNHWRSFLVAVIAAVFMSAIGAFDSRLQPPVQRLFFWLVLLMGGTVLGSAIMSFARGLSVLDDRPWLRGATLTLLIWGPATVMVWMVIAFMRFAPLNLASLLANAGPVLVVSAAMTMINYLADRDPRATHATEDAAASPPPFLARAPARLRRAELYAVEAEDHYLRLHTSEGSDLILMRLSDAMDELEGIEGAQTHRSWWVARGGVDEARRADGRATLRLKSGAEVPVSRTYVRALRQAGWF